MFRRRILKPVETGNRLLRSNDVQKVDRGCRQNHHHLLTPWVFLPHLTGRCLFLDRPEETPSLYLSERVGRRPSETGESEWPHEWRTRVRRGTREDRVLHGQWCVNLNKWKGGPLHLYSRNMSEKFRFLRKDLPNYQESTFMGRSPTYRQQTTPWNSLISTLESTIST